MRRITPAVCCACAWAMPCRFSTDWATRSMQPSTPSTASTYYWVTCKPCWTRMSSNLRIHLAQAMSSSEKMDWVIQKATELGATSIQPVQTQRSVAKLAESRAEKRTLHWQGVTIAACEQSGRNTLPVTQAPMELEAWLETQRASATRNSSCCPKVRRACTSRPGMGQDVVLLIGPEGGFTSDEALTRTTCRLHAHSS